MLAALADFVPYLPTLVLIVSGITLATNALAENLPATASGTPRIATARVGLSKHYKLGTWTPVAVEVTGTDDSTNLRVDVIASDNDGVATTASAPLAPPESQGRFRQAFVYTQVGRVRSPVRIVLANGDNELDSLILAPVSQAASNPVLIPMPASSHVIVSLGTADLGLPQAFPPREASQSQSARILVNVPTVAELPAEWFGYDAANVIILAAGDDKFCRDLAKDKPRFAALQKWVEFGGRLVVFCGGDDAQATLQPAGPLAPFLPGKLAGVVSLPDAVALESFAASAPRITGTAIPVPRLTDVEGKIEAYAGRRPTDLPLIVRSLRGFGEITFVALEFDQPPLADWPGRTAFFQSLLRPYIADAVAADVPQRLATSGITDLAGALRQQLGRNFSSVTTIGFPVVAGLAFAYLFVLGPLDYLIIHRWLRRPLAAWVTFPVIVLGFTAAALAIGNWSKGAAGTRVNHLSLVDFDTTSNLSRGTLWSAIFSPDAIRLNLAVKSAPSTPDPRLLAPDPSFLLSWWGLPGGGIGGMQVAGSDLGIIPRGYRFGPEHDSLEDMPILTSGTKSLIARWTAQAAATIESDLSDADDLLVGKVSNETGHTLLNVRLFYGSWGYQLGTMRPDQQIDITDELSPRHAKTILTRDALGGSGAVAAQVQGRQFSPDDATPKQILNLMMFYDAAGGLGFARVPNRSQSQIDLSRQLELGRAVLVADVAASTAELIDQHTGQPLAGENSDGTTVYRFILPVNKPAQTNAP